MIESVLVDVSETDPHPALTMMETIYSQLSSEKVVLTPLVPRFLRLRIQVRATGW